MSPIDWWSLGIFLLLMLLGWMNIYAAEYNPAADASFTVSSLYGRQLMWIGACIVMGLLIMVLHDKYYHILAYPLYALGIVALLAALIVGKEVKGAHSWLAFGPISLQPAEFAKFTTILAVARVMSSYNFSIRRMKNLLAVAGLIMLPIAIILLQNDTGSALVYCSFLLLLYREGLNGWIYVALAMVIGLFVCSFVLTPMAVLVLLIAMLIVCEGIANGNWKGKIIFVSSLMLAVILEYLLLNVIFRVEVSAYVLLLFTSVLSLIVVFIYAYRRKLTNVYIYMMLFVGSLLFLGATDFVFDHLQIHQQKRILDLLGVEQDLQNWGYNVNQSKIAIGSGGFFGKGFLHGTQTQYNFVPEQTTDFIFCTVGEEWGFVGSVAVLVLFGVMIVRLMKMGERQSEPFGRIYCYGVAGVFLFHLMVNVGMTIGLMPVIGIPLPLFSYGGSSLLAFSLLFFVALRFDARRRMHWRQLL